MLTANCTYYEYVLSEKPQWLDRLSMFVSETFWLPGYRQEKHFEIVIDHPEIFLKSRQRFFVAGKLIGRDGEVEFEIEKWIFRFGQDGLALDLNVRKVGLTPLMRWFDGLTPGWQYVLAGASVVLPLAILLFVGYSIVNYSKPTWFWNWFGLHIRGIVGWGLFLLLLFADFLSVLRFRRSPFVQNIALFVLSFSVLLIPILWMQISLVPSEMLGKSDQGILYVDYLKARVTTATLLLAGIVPWLTLVLKWLGLDFLASAIGLALKKSEKKPPE